jgi:hypothetical protein
LNRFVPSCSSVCGKRNWAEAISACLDREYRAPDGI